MRITPQPAAGRRFVRTLATGFLAVAGVLAAGPAHAAGTPQPQPRDANGNLSNSITSTSTGSNCVTGSEEGCFTVTPRVVPVVGDDALAGYAVLTFAGGALLVQRRRVARR